MPTSQPLVFDAVVIGAGMAGLTAARRLAEARKSTLILEASERVGGRVWSVPGASGAIELGAEFVHGEPEPTLAVAREAGVQLLPVSDVHFVKHGAAFQALADPWQPFESVLSRLEPEDEDTSAKAFVAQNGIDPDLAERFRQLVEGFEVAPFEEVSIRSLATDSAGVAEDDSQFRVAGGYGRLVEFQRERALLAGAELRLGVPVQRLKWHLNGPVSVDFGGSTPELTAKICVVAVPLSALQSDSSPDRLRVEPAISSWRKPLERLAMGHACRYSFELPLRATAVLCAERGAAPGVHSSAPFAVRDRLVARNWNECGLDRMVRWPEGHRSGQGDHRPAREVGTGRARQLAHGLRIQPARRAPGSSQSP